MLQLITPEGPAYVLATEIVGLSQVWNKSLYGADGEATATVHARTVHLRGGGCITISDETQTVSSVLHALESNHAQSVSIVNGRELVRHVRDMLMQQEPA